MNINLKVGESGWFRTNSGMRALVVNVGLDRVYPLIGTIGDNTRSWGLDGKSFDDISGSDHLAEYLPECTGWDWKPEPQVHKHCKRLRKCVEVLRGYAVFGMDGQAAIDAVEEITNQLEKLETPK